MHMKDTKNSLKSILESFLIVCMHTIYFYGRSKILIFVFFFFYADIEEDEMLVPVAHYQKEAYSTFGHPFLMKVKEGESFESVKERVQAFLDVPDKEFEKYRVSLVYMGRPRYLDEEQIKSVRLRDFVLNQDTKNSGSQHAKPFIGLQHQNKNSKRARYNYMEKAIKIYN